MLKKNDKQQGSSDSSLWLEMLEVSTQSLTISRFSAARGEAWCVLGDNRSGVDKFVGLLSGTIGIERAGLFDVPENLAVVSFAGQQELYEEEIRKDDTDYLNRLDPGTPARDFIGSFGDRDDLVRMFRLEHVLDSGYRQLSSGESRKLLLLEAITHGATSLLVEKPYDGLDVQACSDFDRAMERLLSRGIGIIIVLASRADVPAWCTHCAVIKSGSLVDQGEKKDVLEGMQEESTGDDWSDLIRISEQEAGRTEPEELVNLVDGRARYGGRTIFSGLDFLVRQEEHTLITGPNGAGKSTLLALITGDHPDCYTNELYLFGTRRGSGESIWELKKEMGIVSPALHREHYVPGNALQIVISGFYDSIGLYRRYNAEQEHKAREWLSRIGLAQYEKTPFRRLSFARQRLTLIARALIKMPKLLILDEPTQGLDDSNRANLLDFLEMVAEHQISTILYVSHRQDEFRGFFRQQVEIAETT